MPLILWPNGVFFVEKKTRTLFDLQKRVLKIWQRPSSQKASIFPKESIGEHFTPARATLRAETALPPQIRPDFLKFASTWGGENCAQRARGGARALMSISNLNLHDNLDDFWPLGHQYNLKSEETSFVWISCIFKKFQFWKFDNFFKIWIFFAFWQVVL